MGLACRFFDEVEDGTCLSIFDEVEDGTYLSIFDEVEDALLIAAAFLFLILKDQLI